MTWHDRASNKTDFFSFSDRAEWWHDLGGITLVLPETRMYAPVYALVNNAYFSTCLQAGFREKTERTITLTETTATAVQLFLNWMIRRPTSRPKWLAVIARDLKWQDVCDLVMLADRWQEPKLVEDAAIMLCSIFPWDVPADLVVSALSLCPRMLRIAAPKWILYTIPFENPKLVPMDFWKAATDCADVYQVGVHILPHYPVAIDDLHLILRRTFLNQVTYVDTQDYFQRALSMMINWSRDTTVQLAPKDLKPYRSPTDLKTTEQYQEWYKETRANIINECPIEPYIEPVPAAETSRKRAAAADTSIEPPTKAAQISTNATFGFVGVVDTVEFAGRRTSG